MSRPHLHPTFAASAAAPRRPPVGRVRAWVAWVLGAVACAPGALVGQQHDGAAASSPSAPEADACTDGRITSVRVDSRSIFDPASTSLRVLQWAYEAANLLHVNTQESFVERELLFEEGDCYDPFLVAESERLLDQYGFLAYARIETEPDENGGHVALVETRDDWSTKVDVGATYDEGTNLEKLQVTEENLLGHGVFGEFTYVNRREVRTHSFGVSTPRLFGRTDAGMAWGRSRPGSFFRQYVRYPFVGEAGRIAVRESFDRGTDFFAYSTGGAEEHSRVLVPIFREQLELSAARRFGEPGSSVILGMSLTRDQIRMRGDPELTIGDGYDDRLPYLDALPERMDRQLEAGSATRFGVHLGTRRFRYEEYVGLDGVRDRQNVGIGLFAGVSVARSIPVLTPSGPRLDDVVTRGHGSFTAALGSSLLHGGGSIEARHERGRWHDVLADADLAFYGRGSALPAQTLFLRASFGGGWNTSLPFQLSLGGREAVRSLPEDLLPGGRMLLFVVEDRITLGWPDQNTADLGVTLFADAGRVFPGDVPYGVDSGWQGAVGFGLRIGLPPGTRNIWRADVVFPVGTAGTSPRFLLTFELNKLRSGFFNPEVFRSRRFRLGPESF